MRFIVIIALALIGIYLLLAKVIVAEPPISITVHDAIPTTIHDLKRKPAEDVFGYTFVITGAVSSTWRVGDLTAIELTDDDASLIVFSDHGLPAGVSEVVTLMVRGMPSAQVGTWSGPVVFVVVESRSP